MHTSPHAASSTIDVRPTAEGERLDVLDAMRGFALAGIFLLNLASFSGFAFMTPEMMSASPTAAVDLPVAGLTVWLGYGKFYSLFSLLFGIGFSLQLAAAERRGDSRLRVFRRRLLVLLSIGAVHLYFWEGDILVLYALVGFVLIPFRASLGPGAAADGRGTGLRSGAARGAHRRHAWRARSRRTVAASGRCRARRHGLPRRCDALSSASRRGLGRVPPLPVERGVLPLRGFSSAPDGRSRCWRCSSLACGWDAPAC